MPRFRWEWRGGTDVDSAGDSLPKQIDIIDGRDGTQYAITDDVQKAERIVSCLNYSEFIAKSV